MEHTVCYCQVTYMFQSASTLYRCMNVKELLAQNRRDILSLSDSNGLRTHNNHIVRRFTLKRVRDMVITYSQMHRTDKYSQHSSVIWPVWLNGLVFVCDLR